MSTKHRKFIENRAAKRVGGSLSNTPRLEINEPESMNLFQKITKYFRKKTGRASRPRPRSVAGFTLVELLVAMAIFAIFIEVAIGVFVQGIRSQRTLMHLMSINNNAASTLEQMAREIRTGTWFCGRNDIRAGGGSMTPCSESEGTLTFVNYKDATTTYTLDTSTGIGRIMREEEIAGGATSGPVPMTASNVDVHQLWFFVQQLAPNTYDPAAAICMPWRVTVLMQVGSPYGDVTNTTNIQTTISSRVLPIEGGSTLQEFFDVCRRY